MKNIINTFFFIALIVLPSTVYAAGVLSEGTTKEIAEQWGSLSGDDALNAPNFEDVIARVIQAFLSLLGMIFIVLMLYGGYTWMTAQGDESKVEKAKATIQRAIIGLIITVSAYSITYTIFKLL